MKVKWLAAATISGILAASVLYAAPSDKDGMTDNFDNLQGAQLADSGMSGNGAAMSMSGTSNPSDSSNMSGTPTNNMSGTATNNMSGVSSPSDEGGADTATGDDY